MSMPGTSRRLSALTATAMVTATETMRPFCRAFRWVALIHRNGQSHSIGGSRKVFTRPSISSHSRLTWLLEMPDVSSA